MRKRVYFFPNDDDIKVICNMITDYGMSFYNYENCEKIESLPAFPHDGIIEAYVAFDERGKEENRYIYYAPWTMSSQAATDAFFEIDSFESADPKIKKIFGRIERHVRSKYKKCLPDIMRFGEGFISDWWARKNDFPFYLEQEELIISEGRCKELIDFIRFQGYTVRNYSIERGTTDNELNWDYVSFVIYYTEETLRKVFFEKIGAYDPTVKCNRYIYRRIKMEAFNDNGDLFFIREDKEGRFYIIIDKRLLTDELSTAAKLVSEIKKTQFVTEAKEAFEV